MTNKQHPALFDWATELLDAEGHVTLSAKEAHEIGARLRSMGEKLKAYEDLDEAASDVQLTPGGIKEFLRGYATEYAKAALASSAPADSVTAPAGGEINRLRAQVESLTRDCGRQASKIAELGSDLKFQEEKHREDRARLQAIYEHRRGECWYWQGDGQDHLESLCNNLPVVIRADQLLALVSTPPTQAADSVLEDAARLDWQDISTAPKDGTRFVAVGNNYGLYSETQHICIAQWFRGCWMEASDWNETSELKYLTHWMPLLPLPGSAARKQGDE